MTAAPHPAGDGAGARPSRWAIGRDWSLRRRVARWFVALVCLLLIAFGALVYSLINFRQKGDELIDRWLPAATRSQVLVADLVNEETGLRGYVIGHQELFLQPYTRYRAQERRDEAALRTALRGHPALLADLDRFVAAADAWHTGVAEPAIARVRQGDRTVPADVVNAASKRVLDRVRAASARLSAALQGVQADAKRARVSAARWCVIAAVIAAALTLGSKWVLWRGLRRQVLEPIEALAAQTRAVAAGNTDHRIVAAGPPEIAALGRDVESMREQIAADLRRVERARAVLIERGEELARSNADLEQFAYVASHDLSEPLRKVANFCQLLERQYGPQLDDKAKQYINFAVDGAKRMQVLISDLLSFSRVGRTTETFEPVDTGDALTRALANLEDRITSSGAEIVRGPLPTITGDPTLIVALFQNLVGNALKYRDAERTPCVRISAEQKGDEWLFTVSDNGIGIDPQYAERIFTIFQRLHLRDQYGGTGIGLALCRKIVEFHRGRIWLATEDGDRPPGATFQFAIPERAAPRDLVDDLKDDVGVIEG